jgi:hypothetical protein
MDWLFPIGMALFLVVIWPAIVISWATDPSNRFFNPEDRSEPKPVDPLYGEGRGHG